MTIGTYEIVYIIRCHLVRPQSLLHFLFKGEWGLEKLAKSVGLEIFCRLKKWGEIVWFFKKMSWVQKLHIVGKRVLSHVSFAVPLFEITSLWSLAHPLVNCDLPDYLLLLYYKLLSLATLTQLMTKPKKPVTFSWWLLFMLSQTVIS